jgi:hypothetical protein
MLEHLPARRQLPTPVRCRTSARPLGRRKRARHHSARLTLNGRQQLPGPRTELGPMGRTLSLQREFKKREDRAAEREDREREEPLQSARALAERSRLRRRKARPPRFSDPAVDFPDAFSSE